MSHMKYLLRFDGGSNPNPGPTAGAYVIYNEVGEVIAEGGSFIENGTNNIGEYTGLLEGMKRCKELGIKTVNVEGDSLLVISQVMGKWKINHEHLRNLCKQITDMIRDFECILFKHIKREFNFHADRLSDQTLERKESWCH